ncbi:uncharacterized protein LOC143459213 [Clavelina lepadiformis]|uniref:uncharacterized protein LOC143459213 n=1 Tax=Clavelina lepadiformis TaxID=159417 RepID=UPI00404313AB
MPQRISDINAKLAYITNRKTGLILKTKRPIVLKNRYVPPQKKSKGFQCLDEFNALMECIQKHNQNSQCAENLQALIKCQQSIKAASGKSVKGIHSHDVYAKLLKNYPATVNKEQYRIQRNLLNTHAETKTKKMPFEDKGRPLNKRQQS